MVLPYGQRGNYYTLLFLFKFLIYPVSDRLATGVSYCWTNLPSTSSCKHGVFFILVEVECRLKSCRVHRVLLFNRKFLFVLLLLPGSVVPISDRGELFGTGAASELSCPAPWRGDHSGAATAAGWCCSWPLHTPCPILGKIKLGTSQKGSAQGL